MRYIIEIDSQTLSPEADNDFHRTDLEYLIRDALWDFVRARLDPEAYVKERYSKQEPLFQAAKINDVKKRHRVAKYLLRHGKISVDIRKLVPDDLDRRESDG